VDAARAIVDRAATAPPGIVPAAGSAGTGGAAMNGAAEIAAASKDRPKSNSKS
jgi:hypothetical protein